MAIQPDSNILIGGNFTEVSGVPRQGLTCLAGQAAGALKVQLIGLNKGERQMRVHTIPIKTYTLEFQDQVAGGAWKSLGSMTGDGTVKTFSDTAGAPQRFYRVRID